MGIIFSSVALGIPGLVSEISSAGFPVFGCSSCGEILTQEGKTPVFEQSAVCCLLDLDPTVFSVALFEKNAATSNDFGRRIGEWGKTVFKNPAFIITVSGLKTDGEAVVRGIGSVCPSGTQIFGGLAGDDSLFRETYVFSGEGYSAEGAVAIVFDGSRVLVEGIVSGGWLGIGTESVITSSDGNIVYSIDNRPAADLYREYLHVGDADLVEIGVTFPLILIRQDGAEVLRAVMAVDSKTGALTFAGSVPQGSRVRFSSSFGYETIKKTMGDLERYHEHHSRADLALLFSCMGRHRAAGTMVNDEIQKAHELWNVPLIGFFTYGEIGPNMHGSCDFHNESFCLVLISYPPGSS